jgi:Asp-tRNA(Asn)/Glu-tRNA(Gln) amidotransferase A subunit family amidase
MADGINRRRVLSITASTAAVSVAGPLQAAAPKGKMPLDEYQAYDATGLAILVGKGDIEPRELLEAAIARLEVVDTKINCISQRLYDYGRKQIADGLPRGPFTGVPFLLKDLGVDLAGTPTASGSKFFQDDAPTADSTLVARYKHAGLVIFGKTTTPELGITGTTESAAQGQTKNPWNLERTTGGSSGGAAAAVATNIVAIANASDGAGSIRVPASCCGVFGLKPTRGRVPRGPRSFESWNGLGTIHAVSRSVRDSAALLDVSAGPDLGDPYSAVPPNRPYAQEVGADPGKLRIALVLSPPNGAPVDPACLDAVHRAAKLCEDLGHIVEEKKLPINQQATFDGLVASLCVSVVRALDGRAARLGRAVTEADVEPITWYFYQQGKKVPGAAYAEARAVFDATGRAMAEFQQSSDIVLSPTLAKPPIKLGLLSLSGKFEDFVREGMGFSPFSAVANMTGQPAMSVPLHWSTEGLPVGVMFMGRMNDEATLFRLAGQLETARPWFNRRPVI